MADDRDASNTGSAIACVSDAARDGDAATDAGTQGDGADTEVEVPGQPFDAVQDFIPRKYDTIESLPPIYMKFLLAAAEPIVLDYHRLHGVSLGLPSRKDKLLKPPHIEALGAHLRHARQGHHRAMHAEHEDIGTGSVDSQCCQGSPG